MRLGGSEMLYILCFMAGVIAGCVLMGLMAASRRADDLADRDFEEFIKNRKN